MNETNMSETSVKCLLRVEFRLDENSVPSLSDESTLSMVRDLADKKKFRVLGLASLRTVADLHEPLETYMVQYERGDSWPAVCEAGEPVEYCDIEFARRAARDLAAALIDPGWRRPAPSPAELYKAVMDPRTRRIPSPVRSDLAKELCEDFGGTIPPDVGTKVRIVRVIPTEEVFG